jgi:hypothetical protein
METKFPKTVYVFYDDNGKLRVEDEPLHVVDKNSPNRVVGVFNFQSKVSIVFKGVELTYDNGLAAGESQPTPKVEERAIDAAARPKMPRHEE